jgi:hypothetical protein
MVNTNISKLIWLICFLLEMSSWVIWCKLKKIKTISPNQHNQLLTKITPYCSF